MRGAAFTLLVFLLLAFPASGQWKELNDGLEGGSITFLESQGNKLYVGTPSGIHYSEDNGETWTLIYESYFQWRVFGFLVHGNDLYVSIGPGKLFKSSNGGQNWAEIFSGPTLYGLVANGNSIYGISSSSDPHLYRIDATTGVTTIVPGVVQPRDIAVSGSKLFLGTNHQGLYVSSNDGANWTKDPSIPDGTLVEVAASGSVVFIMSPTKFISLNEGATWTSANTVPYFYSPTVLKEGSIVFLGGSNYAQRSTDGGITWSVIQGLSGMSSMKRTPWGLFAGSYVGMHRSQDGVTWTKINSGIRSVGAKRLVVQDNYLFTVVDRRIFKTNTGVWQECAVPTTEADVLSTIAVSGPNLVAGTYGYGIFYSRDKGETWTKSEGLNSIFSEGMVTIGNRLYAGNYSGGLFLSMDHGATWHQIDTYGGVRSLAVLKGYLYVGRKWNDNAFDVSRYDRNHMRVAMNTGLTDAVNSFTLLGDSLFCMTYQGWIHVYDSNTQAWKVRRPPNGPLTHDMVSHQDRLYVVRTSNVQFSDDHGFQWTDYSDGIPLRAELGLYARALRVLNGDLYFLTSSAGIWTTSDRGTLPYALTRSIDNLPDFTISLWGGPGPEGPPFNGNFSNWDQGLAGDEMFSFDFVTGIDDSKKGLRLFPNPVSTQLGISIDLKSVDCPQIEILDLSGHVVTTETATGSTTLIDTQHFPSGLYMVRVRSNNDVVVQKFVKR